MPKWELVKEGDLLWERRRQRMGNTTIRQTAYFQVKILSINHEEGFAMVSWNHPMNLHRPVRWGRRDVVKLTRKKPEQKKKKLL